MSENGIFIDRPTPPLSEDITSLIPKIQQWAASLPWKVRVYIHGSRIYGTHKPDSDLDIGVELVEISDWSKFNHIEINNQKTIEESLRELVVSPLVNIVMYRAYDQNRSKVFPTNAASYLVYDGEAHIPEMVEGIRLQTIFQKI